MRKRGDVEERPTTEFTVPLDPVNEQVVLAALVVAYAGNDLQTTDQLLTRIQPECFFVEEHRNAWIALRAIRQRRLAYDPATLLSVAGEKGVPINLTSLGELASLRGKVPANLEYHVDSLLWDRKRAAAARGPLSSLLDALRNPAESPDRVKALARHVAESFEGHNDKQHLLDSSTLVRDQMAEIRRRIEGRAIYPYGIPGLDYFDGNSEGASRMIPGAAPGQITMLTGTPGSGKSTVAANITLGIARQRRRVLYCAWEPAAGMTLEVLAVVSLGWNRSDLLDPKGAALRGRSLTPELLSIFEARMMAIGEYVTFAANPFRKRSGEKRSNDRNLDIVHGIINASGCDVVVFDLWRRCLVDGKPDEEEEALFRQQAMLEEEGKHGILLHQQRHKDVELRADKRPTREGMKGSGAYLEVADTVLAPHRPAQWKPSLDDDTLQLFYLKQRWGKWPGGIEFDWSGERGSISGGREIPYDQAGESEGGELMSKFRAPNSARMQERKRR